MPKVMLTGGGTGGHIYPCLALVPALERRGMTVIYGGGEGDTPERRLAELRGLPFFGVPCVAFKRQLTPAALKNNLGIPSRLREGVKRAKDILSAERPDAVFSKGGYAALPFVLAAKKLGVPVVSHESDSTLGLSNRIAKLTGARVLTAFPGCKAGEFVGMPVREELFCSDPEEARRAFSLSPDARVLLITGGSSGAASLNAAVKKALPLLIERFAVIHLTGKNKGEGLPPRSERYIPLAYTDDMGALYAASDVVVSRAGATAVAEISALEKRAVFVPLPKGASRGDQIPNAALAEKYGAIVLPDDRRLPVLLPAAVERALRGAPMRHIASDTGGKIADILDATIRRGVICKDKKPSPNGSQ